MKELIQWDENTILIGKRITTRGNDEDFPAFIIDDACEHLSGMHVSVDKKRVIGKVEEPDDDDLGDTETKSISFS